MAQSQSNNPHLLSHHFDEISLPLQVVALSLCFLPFTLRVDISKNFCTSPFALDYIAFSTPGFLLQICFSFYDHPVVKC